MSVFVCESLSFLIDYFITSLNFIETFSLDIIHLAFLLIFLYLINIAESFSSSCFNELFTSQQPSSFSLSFALFLKLYTHSIGVVQCQCRSLVHFYECVALLELFFDCYFLIGNFHFKNWDEFIVLILQVDFGFDFKMTCQSDMIINRMHNWITWKIDYIES